MKNSLAILALVMLAGFSLPVSAQVKIGTVNSQQILENIPETKSIQQQMQKLKEAAESEFAAKVQKFQEDAADYERKKELLTPEKRKQTESELQSKQQELQQLNQFKVQELQQKQVELTKPMEEKVMAAIEAVAKKEGLTLVLDKTNSIANVVMYADDSLDITFKVLDYLKTAKGPAKPKSSK